MLRYPGVTSTRMIPVIDQLGKMDPQILARVDIDGEWSGFSLSEVSDIPSDQVATVLNSIVKQQTFGSSWKMRVFFLIHKWIILKSQGWAPRWEKKCFLYDLRLLCVNWILSREVFTYDVMFLGCCKTYGRNDACVNCVPSTICQKNMDAGEEGNIRWSFSRRGSSCFYFKLSVERLTNS